MQFLHVAKALILTIVVSCQAPGQVPTDPAATTESGMLAQAVESRSGGGLGRTGFVLYSGSDLSRTAMFEHHDLGFDLSTIEYVAGTSVFHQWSLSNPTSFGIERVVGRNGNEFLVCGRTRRGDLVIELWALPATEGGWYSSNPNPGTGLGVQTALTQTTDVVSGSGWVAPEQRSAQSPARKREVYLGDAISRIGGIAVDPEGRFAILVDQDNKSVYRLLLDGSGTLTPLADVATFSFLGDLESLSVEILQDGLQGRVYAIGTRTFRGEGGVILADPNNDGLFDPPFWLSHGDVDTAFPKDIWLNVGS